MKYIKFICVAIVALVIGLFVVYGNARTSQVFDAYQSLSARPANSKANFTKKLQFVMKLNNTFSEYTFTIDKNGNIVRDDGVIVDENGEPTEEGSSGGSNGDSEDDGEWQGDSLAFSALDMYDKYNYTGKGTAVVSLTNGVSLYNGIPWADDGTWYQLDLDSVSRYLNSVLNKTLNFRSSLHTDNYNDVAVSKDSVVCAGIAWLPIYSFCSFTDSGTFSPAWSGSLAGSGKCYGVAILEKNGTTYYLPIASGGDNKGHTWPGGLAQTYIGNGTRVSGNNITFNSGGASDRAALKWDDKLMHGLTVSSSDLKSGWATLCKYNGGGMTSHPSITIETTTEMIQALSGYSVKGFIIHRGS